MNRVKLVTVGDFGVGKTCLLIRYTTGEFPILYIPRVFDDWEINKPENTPEVQVNSTESVILVLCDTGGAEDYEKLRPLFYPDTSVFLSCCNIAYPYSFDYIETNMIPELNKFAPAVPVILVGTKCDLRDNIEVKEKLDKKGLNFKTFDEGVVLAEKMKAVAYLECSALSGEGVKEVFDKAAEVAYDFYIKFQKKKTNIRCRLL